MSNDMTQRSWRPQIVILVWGCILVAALFAMNAAAPGGRKVIAIRGIDPNYYFSTSHALLFHHDFDLRSEFQALKPEGLEPCRWGCRDGMPLSPYAIGYSILSIPFLAGGTLIDGILGRSADGYSATALSGFFLANVVFVVLGMVFLSRFLQQVWAPWPAALLTVAIWFGTTVGFYTFAPMAHAATFMMSAAFLLVWWQVKESDSIRAWILLGLCGGLLSICRWQDILFLLAPPLVDLLQHRKWAAVRKWFAYGAAAFVWWIPQITQWKMLYGSFVTEPHGPGFFEEFSFRYVIRVLFASQHGWFTWTPMVVVGVVGLIIGARKNPALYWPWIVVIALQVVAVAAVLTPHHYDEAFGMRMLTSSVPLIAWGIATLMGNLRPPILKPLLAGFILVCMVYTTLFAVQFRLNLIPRGGPLTVSEMLWDKVFLMRAYHRHVLEIRNSNPPKANQ